MAAFFKNAVYPQNHVSCPFPVVTSFIWPQLCPWSGIYYSVVKGTDLYVFHVWKSESTFVIICPLKRELFFL